MSVRQNIAFGLEVQKLPRREIRDRVDELLELVQMTGYQDRYPAQLSGGQRQRVALAPRWHRDPRCFSLMNHSVLSTPACETSWPWLRRLHDEVHMTSLFVTHDQEEAFEVADQVIVLNRGRIEQMGPPQELYERPATPFVTGFLGSVNVLRVQKNAGASIVGHGSRSPADADGAAAPVELYVRPHDLDLVYQRNGKPAWAGQVARVMPLGAFVRVDVTLNDGTSAGRGEPGTLCRTRPATTGCAALCRGKRLQGFSRAGTAGVTRCNRARGVQLPGDDPSRDADGRDQAGRIGNTLPGDVERCPVRDAACAQSAVPASH